MLGRSVDITVPSAACCRWPRPSGRSATRGRVTGVVLGVVGDMAAPCCCSSRPRRGADVRHARRRGRTEIGESALMEIGNIVGTSYINALAR
jgi:chemotaxis protein CheC